MSADQPAFRFLLVPREGDRQTLLVYGRDNCNPTASCQIILRNGIARLDTLMGADFYRSLLLGGLDVFFGLDAAEFRAAVRKSHLALMQRQLRGSVDIEQTGETCIGEVDLTEVRLKQAPGYISYSSLRRAANE